MSNIGSDFSLLILLLGGILVLTMFTKSLLERTLFPPLVGYLLIGLLIRQLHTHTSILPQSGLSIFAFLGQIGLVTLLFKVGLESELGNLASQFKKASVVWVGNILFAAGAGYWVSHGLLYLDTIPSLIVGLAFTATSVGITAKMWEDADALDTKQGALLLDLAELDDVTAVVLMALLFTIIPVLQAGGGNSLSQALTRESVFLLAKMGVFGGICYFFAHFLERPITRLASRMEPRPDSSLTIAGIGFIIAALAGLLGFSLAVGAFFAGLVFCRDPKAVKLEQSFYPVYDFFSPFFFIAIGMEFDVSVVSSSIFIGAVLGVFAIASKIIGNWLPFMVLGNTRNGLLIAASMVPRAEIALVVTKKGLDTGAVPSDVYGGMVVASALTCLVAPPLVAKMLKQTSGTGQDKLTAGKR